MEIEIKTAEHITLSTLCINDKVLVNETEDIFVKSAVIMAWLSWLLR
jgi:hypothetical protein